MNLLTAHGIDSNKVVHNLWYYYMKNIIKQLAKAKMEQQYIETKKT